MFYLLASAPTFALAWLSWRLFEAPILRLKSRFPYA
jgi:peptidoglycan/LPS O-acetylase OafA/YrhL